jgi:hypothetical protein
MHCADRSDTIEEGRLRPRIELLLDWLVESKPKCPMESLSGDR